MTGTANAFDKLDKFFRLTERNTDVRTEVLGGITTFVTMAYIIVVNPAILSFAGFPVGPSTVATILTAIFGCLLMGLYANLPIAVAPYMGENAFIAFGLAAMGISWQLRLGAVFISGIAFLILSLARIRSWLANAISPSMKYSFGVGIGLFLTFIGMYETGIVTSGAAGMPAAALTLPSGMLRAPDVPVKIGDFHNVQVLLAIFGFIVISVLQYRKVRGAILLGIAINALIGIALGFAKPPQALMAMPFQGQYSLAPIALQLDVRGVLTLAFFPILLTLFLMSFLDTLGTLVGVGANAGLLDKDGNFPEMEKPMLVDSLSCVAGSLLGSSTSGAFIESATGIREGARTGLAAVVVAMLFAVSLFFLPVVEPLQQLRFAYAPALISVGLLMMKSITKVDLEDLTEAVPAFATIVMIMFTYNIANGLTAGLILYPLLKVLAGRARELHPGSLALAALCLIYYLFGLPH
jgi:adenine/guanine/hypoxanthine permease